VTRRLAPALLLAPALALLAATRLPRAGWTGLVATVALAAAALLGILLLRESQPRWAKPALTLAALALFLVPPASGSVAPHLPAALPALALLLFLDALHAQPGAAAPSLDGEAARRPWVRRSIAIAAIAGLLLALAPAAALLPARLADTHELHGVELPLLAGATVLVPLLLFVWGRDVLRSRATRAPAAEAPRPAPAKEAGP
jgi:hypothetical protein